MSMQDEITITLNMTIKIITIVIIVILITKTNVGLTRIGKVLETSIILILAQIVVRKIILYQNAGITTELNVIIVMNMDIKLDYVPMRHSNQLVL